MPTEPDDAPALHRVMGGTEFFTLALGTIVGVGWVVVMHDWLSRGGPLGAILGFVLGGLLCVPIGVVYGHLTAGVPQAGAEMAYMAGLFPRWARFAVGWVMALGYLVVCPFEAVAVGQLAGQMIPAFESLPLYRVGEHTVYLPELALGLTLVVALTAVNIRGVGHSARVQNAFTFGLLAVFAVFATLGATRGRPDNLPPLFARGEDVWGAVASAFLVLQIVPYYLAGFETVARVPQHARPGFRPQRFVGIVLAALAAGVAFYVAVIFLVAWLSPWQGLAESGSATLNAFRRAFGSELLVNLILFGAILSLIKVFNGCLLSASRLLFALGRGDAAGPFVGAGLGALHGRFGTPHRATLVAGAFAVLGCLLGKSVLVPISEVGSFAIVVGWLAACLAYCGGAGKRSRRERWLFGGGGAAVAVLLLAMKLVPGVEGSFTRWEHAALGAWLLCGLALWLLRPGPLAPPPEEKAA
jgi:amino acid transporter